MVLGYRYKNGISVQQNCQKAQDHYSLVARVVIEDLTYSGGVKKNMLPISMLNQVLPSYLEKYKINKYNEFPTYEAFQQIGKFRKLNLKTR